MGTYSANLLILLIALANYNICEKLAERFEYEDYVHTRPLMYDTETTLNHYVFEKAGGLSVRLIKIN